MRWISVSPADIREQPGGALGQGTDNRTGELVEFSMSLDVAAAVKVVSGASLLPVDDADVISVEPVRGEWDSPGTSPEDA